MKIIFSTHIIYLQYYNILQNRAYLQQIRPVVIISDGLRHKGEMLQEQNMNQMNKINLSIINNKHPHKIIKQTESNCSLLDIIMFCNNCLEEQKFVDNIVNPRFFSYNSIITSASVTNLTLCHHLDLRAITQRNYNETSLKCLKLCSMD